MKTKTFYYSLAVVLTLTLMACQQKNDATVGGEAVTETEELVDAVKSDKTDAHEIIDKDFFSKGTIESVSDVAVASRISEQIVMLGVEMGQRVRKGQVVVQLDKTAVEDKILNGRAELERAEYQYQNILIGQGYKRGAFDEAPENIREMARINSGYNTAKAALQQMERQLSYCIITAPISGVVTQLNAALYEMAAPGETLFRIVDTEHLKVCFDVLENELQPFDYGTEITLAPFAFLEDRHHARITAVSPVVEKNGVVHLEATLTPHPHLKPGMSVIIAYGNVE
ncbi:MAG: efflux RND transporter periplasmic adaptor subunit [Prevotella sp.]|nr:efflux RND transporter periplasmic adaptor subunit [Prevotella sp.]